MVEKVNKMISRHEREAKEAVYGLLREMQEGMKEGMTEYLAHEYPVDRSVPDSIAYFVPKGEQFFRTLALVKEGLRIVTTTSEGKEVSTETYPLEAILEGETDFGRSTPLMKIFSYAMNSSNSAYGPPTPKGKYIDYFQKFKR